MSTVAASLKEPHLKILVYFKRMGGHGHISGVREAGKVKTGDRYVRRLIAQGLMHQQGYDDYALTPEGFAEANKAIAEGTTV